MIPRGTGGDFVRTYGIPRKLDGAVEVALRGAHARDRRRPRALPRLAGAAARSLFANVAGAGMSGAIAKRTNETSKALGGKVSYAWATFAVFSRWRNGEVTVRGRRRGAHRPDARRDRRQRPLPRRRDEDAARRRAGRRPLRRAPDRRPDQARPGADPAEDLPRHAPAPPEGDAAAGRGRRDRVSRAVAGRARRRAARDDARAFRDRAAALRLRVPA